MLRSKTVQSSSVELRAARRQYLQIVESIDAAILALERVADSAQPRFNYHSNPAQADGGAKSTTKERGVKRRRFPRTPYRKAIADVFRRNGLGELSVRQIVDALRTGGRKIRSKNAYRTIYRAMKQSPQFRNAGRKWTLAERADGSSAVGES